MHTIPEDGAATLLGTLRPYRWRIVFTYALTLLENVFELLYPFAIGVAINGLIAGSGWTSLGPLGAVWAAHIATGAVRQLYDTRLFTKIYTAVAGGMVRRQRAAGASTSVAAARSAMAREAMDFLEFDLPGIMTTVIGLFGGIAMLFLYDAVSGAIMAGVILPIAALNIAYGRRALALNTRLNNRHEREVDAIRDGHRRRLYAHYRALARWRVMLSDAQVRSWSTAALLSLGAVSLVILQVTAQPGVQAGDVFAALVYVMTVLDAFQNAPIIVHQVSRLIDIRRRVDRDTPGAEDADKSPLTSS